MKNTKIISFAFCLVLGASGIVFGMNSADNNFIEPFDPNKPKATPGDAQAMLDRITQILKSTKNIENNQQKPKKNSSSSSTEDFATPFSQNFPQYSTENPKSPRSTCKIIDMNAICANPTEVEESLVMLFDTQKNTLTFDNPTQSTMSNLPIGPISIPETLLKQCRHNGFYDITFDNTKKPITVNLQIDKPAELSTAEQLGIKVTEDNSSSSSSTDDSTEYAQKLKLLVPKETELSTTEKPGIKVTEDNSNKNPSKPQTGAGAFVTPSPSPSGSNLGLGSEPDSNPLEHPRHNPLLKAKITIKSISPASLDESENIDRQAAVVDLQEKTITFGRNPLKPNFIPYCILDQPIDFENLKITIPKQNGLHMVSFTENGKDEIAYVLVKIIGSNPPADTTQDTNSNSNTPTPEVAKKLIDAAKKDNATPFFTTTRLAVSGLIFIGAITALLRHTNNLPDVFAQWINKMMSSFSSLPNSFAHYINGTRPQA